MIQSLAPPDTGNVGAIPAGMTEDDVMALARIASSENHYAGGRCVRMEFTPANILAFVAALPPPGRGMVPMDWQPIETAPKDGTRILGYGDVGLESTPMAATVVFIDPNNYWRCDPNEASEYDYERCTLTHWMPLPPPPHGIKEGS